MPAPYPQSTQVASLVWDYAGRQRKAVGSDLFATTWASDGHLYVAWGDGWGFTPLSSKWSMGVSRIEGTGYSHTGYDLLNSQATGKCGSGLISIDGRLWLYKEYQGVWDRCWLRYSDDLGASWTETSSPIFQEANAAFAAPIVINFGQDNAGALDDYVYMYTERWVNPDNELYLARVHKSNMLTRASYEFFNGVEGVSESWTSNINNMTPAFVNSAGVLWGSEAFYHPQLQRYWITARHNTTGGWGIYDAPTPWGPWTTVYWIDTGWIDTTEKFCFAFNQKWIENGGLRLYMSFNGVGQWDSYNVIQVDLTLGNTIVAGGIASAEAFGNATVTTTATTQYVYPTMIGTAEAMGAVVVTGSLTFPFSDDFTGIDDALWNFDKWFLSGSP